LEKRDLASRSEQLQQLLSEDLRLETVRPFNRQAGFSLLEET
jgi:hypothetical protein